MPSALMTMANIEAASAETATVEAEGAAAGPRFVEYTASDRCSCGGVGAARAREVAVAATRALDSSAASQGLHQASGLVAANLSHLRLAVAQHETDSLFERTRAARTSKCGLALTLCLRTSRRGAHTSL